MRGWSQLKSSQVDAVGEILNFSEEHIVPIEKFNILYTKSKISEIYENKF